MAEPKKNDGPKNDGPDQAPPRWIPVALAGSVVLMVVAAGGFYAATRHAPAVQDDSAYRIEVGAKSCTPMDFSIPAGASVFEIHNTSDRPIEWEILDGPMVVEERENILPGLRATLTAKLKPGSYQITCGLLSNPRGALTVTPTAASDAERAAPPIKAFIGPLSEYKVYLTTQSAELTKAAAALEAAIRAGDLDAAKAAWLAARLPYKRVEPLAARFADLENAIDPLPEYLAQREADPAFTGFHRIEYGLWGQGGTADLTDVAAKLTTDVAQLADALKAAKLGPGDLADLAQSHAARVSEGQATAGEDRWSGADLPDLAASREGIEKPLTLILPVVSEADPKVAEAVTASIAALNLPNNGSFADLDDATREQIAKGFAALGTAAGTVNPSIGLD